VSTIIKFTVVRSLAEDQNCVLCEKYVRFPERQMYRDPATNRFIHRHCASAVMKGVYQWNKRKSKYEKVSQ
jgi:predicted DCC family thiol-disulfide oxidoreductase YuxK